ncbi:MAG: hypothetical protein ACYS9Y_13500 [Planctomycetota bacterium]
MRGFGFNEPGDAEVLAAGYNTGKEYGAVAVGRHANFLQWGYAAEPSNMSEDGQKFFLNCIAYISGFDGKTPLIRPKANHRTKPIWFASLIGKVKQPGFFDSIFPTELMDKYRDDPDALVKFYRDNFEFIYKDGVFRIDKEVKSLGLASNRRDATLKKLIELSAVPTGSETVQKLLKRYTRQTFTDPAQWRNWYQTNKDRIYFSDVAGYKFLVVPEEYWKK